MHMLSISVKFPNSKRALKLCRAYASGTDAFTEHARKELMRMLSVHAYAQLAHKKLNEAWLPQNLKKLVNILTLKSSIQKGFMV